MLVNTIYDLQMINLFLSGNYTSSTNIDASVTKEWDSGKGSLPLGRENHPFSGNFAGNGYNISALHINRAEQDNVELLIGTAFFTEISGINYDDRSILQVIKFTDNIVGKGPVSKKFQIC